MLDLAHKDLLPIRTLPIRTLPIRNTECIDLLLKHGAKSRCGGAVEKEMTDIVAMYIAQGAVNATLQDRSMVGVFVTVVLENSALYGACT